MTDTDATVLHAEVAALQAVLIALLRRLSSRPDAVSDLCDAFAEAETILSGLAVKLAPEEASLTTLSALRVVEEIRRGVLRDGDCH